MYKNKITQWGLDKNNKENEIRAIVRKTTQRAAVGKKSVARIRGRVLDPEEIQRYLKRKSHSMESAQVHSASTPPRLECFTPSEIPASPRTPEVFSIPEHIFTMIQDYITGSFQSGTWICKNLWSECHSIKRCYAADAALSDLQRWLKLACGLFDTASSEEGIRMLAAAVVGIKDILMAEAPEVFIRLFALILNLKSRGRPDIILRILGQFADMAAIVLPTRHPIGQICRHLMSLDSHQLTNIVSLAFQSVVDRFESILGQTSYSALTFRTECHVTQADDLRQKESSFRGLLQKCISVRGGCDDVCLRLLLLIVRNLLDQKRFVEAEDTALDSVARASHSDTEFTAYYYCESLRALGRAQSALGKISLAELSFWQAIEHSVSTWGWRNAMTLDYLFHLETVLVKWGKHTSAAKVRTQRREIIESLDVIV
jgi:hypothetical protein